MDYTNTIEDLFKNTHESAFKIGNSLIEIPKAVCSQSGIVEHEELDLRGLWVIKESNTVKTEENSEFIDDKYIARSKAREGLMVVFPYKIQVGLSLIAVYFSFDKDRCDNNNKMLQTSKVERIQSLKHDYDYDSIQVSTMNTQYVFNRRC